MPNRDLDHLQQWVSTFF